MVWCVAERVGGPLCAIKSRAQSLMILALINLFYQIFFPQNNKQQIQL